MFWAYATSWWSPVKKWPNGDHRDATPVADLDELDLINAIQSLQNGVDMAGFSLNGSPEFTIGCTLPSFANDQALEEELAELEKKIAAGAQFVVTPPVFDVERFSCSLEKIAALDVPVIATVFLIKSVGIARYMALNEPGAAYFRRNDQTHPQSPRQRIGMPEDRRGDHCRTQTAGSGRKDRNPWLGAQASGYPWLCGALKLIHLRKTGTGI
jgi:hypothetical protein